MISHEFAGDECEIEVSYKALNRSYDYRLDKRFLLSSSLDNKIILHTAVLNWYIFNLCLTHGEFGSQELLENAAQVAPQAVKCRNVSFWQFYS